MPASRPARPPHGLRRIVLAGVVAALLGSLLVAEAQAAAPSASAGPPVPRLHWAPCGDGLECATAQVPLDYDQPSGATISLALIRLPASDPSRRIGSIFVNPGGPGKSGVDTIRQGGRSLFSAEVRARFDLVGFDPRGIGASTPLRCFATLDQALARRLLANPAQTPKGPVGYADLVYATLRGLQDPAAWPGLAEQLEELNNLTNPSAAATRPAGSQQEYPNLEGLPGVACSDSNNPDQIGAWRRAADASEHAAPYFGRYWTWQSSICQPWPGRDPDRYTGPWTSPTANPVLLVGNRFDPATPYRGAVTLARRLPRSCLLTLDGWGHTSEGKSSCIDAYTARYLLTTQVPQPGTVCQPDVVPFAHPSAQTVGGHIQPSRSS